MAAVAGMSSKPPTPFAALLRRSRFASYDPRICQVYTSFGGDAHRGNWGLKRSLPLRKRAAHISIGAVDTTYQQTVWDHAGTETRFVKMWDEVGINPEVTTVGSWRTKIGYETQSRGWLADSEFEKKEKGMEAWRQVDTTSSVYGRQSSSYLNEHAMSDKQFEAYLEQLRKKRPAFRKYLQEISAGIPDGFDSLWRKSAVHNQLQKNFLARLAYDFYNSPESRAIEQKPAPSAGLSYKKTSQLQSLASIKAHKGRVLEKSHSGREGLVGFAGFTALLPADTIHTKQQDRIEWEKLARDDVVNQDSGIGEFRIIEATLESPPPVVGKYSAAEAMQRMKLTVNVMGDFVRRERENTYQPGTVEYAGAIPTINKSQRDTVFNVNVVKTKHKSQVEEAKNGEQVLGLLTNLLGQRS